VLANESVNTFSLPGGPVYVTRGLLENVSNEGQLAAGLAHEMGHVNARHAARALVRQAGMQAILDVLGISDGGPDGGVARREGSRRRVVEVLVSHQYTPEQESEADRLGLDYMVAARYDPAEMVRMLQGFEALNASKPVAWLATHRGPANRTEGLQKIIQEKYPGRRGRTGEEEYKREVVERLAGPKS
jgi:predicted Zn-dependent protease